MGVRRNLQSRPLRRAGEATRVGGQPCHLRTAPTMTRRCSGGRAGEGVMQKYGSTESGREDR